MARAFRSAVVESPIGAVWETIRPFDALRDWHPLCPDTVIEGGGSPLAIGAVRRIQQTDGNLFRERLLALSDDEYRQTYTMLEPPKTVSGMITTLRLWPITDGEVTYLSWSSDVAAGEKRDEADFVEFIEDAFMVGIRRLQELHGAGAAGS